LALAFLRAAACFFSVFSITSARIALYSISLSRRAALIKTAEE
jgi:hypothetical protein